MNKKVYLFGASGHGKVIHEIAKSINVRVIAFVDDKPNRSELQGIPVFKTDDINSVSKEYFIIAVGNNKVRKEISKRLQVNYTFLTDISAIVANSVSIDSGTVIMPNVTINVDCKIGKHTIINTAAVVEHDCIIGDFVHISPNSTITGGVTVGEGTQIGAGAVIIPNVSIGKWVTIGAGSVILNDIPDYATVVGNPGKIIKQQENE